MPPDRRIGEDDEVLLGEVFDHLEVIVAQVQLTTEGFAEVVRLHVVAVAVEPANSSLVDELVTAAPDGARRQDSTEAVGGPGSRVSRVPCSRHPFLTAHHLRKGTMVGLVVF